MAAAARSRVLTPQLPCSDFLQRALQVDPLVRASASDLLRHPWVAGAFDRQMRLWGLEE